LGLCAGKRESFSSFAISVAIITWRICLRVDKREDRVSKCLIATKSARIYKTIILYSSVFSCSLRLSHESRWQFMAGRVKKIFERLGVAGNGYADSTTASGETAYPENETVTLHQATDDSPDAKEILHLALLGSE